MAFGDGLQQLERRMTKRYLASGIGLIVASPFVFFLVGVPFGIGALVGGIFAVVRAVTFSSQHKNPR